jgi:hypothetical protein
MDGICRECLTSMDCTGGRICQQDHSCGPCTMDTQCDFAGAVCVGGMCPPSSDVAVADCAAMCPGMGTEDMPYCLLSAAVNTGKRYVVMMPRACNYDSGQIQNRTQEIDGRGATVQVLSGESGIFVTGDQADAYVHNLSVTSQTTQSQNGVMVTSNGHLRLENVTVYGMPGNLTTGIRAETGNLIMRKCLVYANAGWGVQLLDAPFRVENSFVVANGSQTNTSTSGTGGVRINGNSSGAFVYNTVARNTFEIPPGLPPKGAGIQCTTNSGTAPIIDSLLIENTQGLTLQDTQGNCDTSQGTITTTGALPQTANDIFVDPSKPQESAMRNRGFHVKLGATSVIHKSVLQPSPTAPDDFDGDLRPAMTTPGADEPLP